MSQTMIELNRAIDMLSRVSTTKEEREVCVDGTYTVQQAMNDAMCKLSETMRALQRNENA
jgi:hypothetical protein